MCMDSNEVNNFQITNILTYKDGLFYKFVSAWPEFSKCETRFFMFIFSIKQPRLKGGCFIGLRKKITSLADIAMSAKTPHAP
jgi:hypothetical protein